MTPSPNWTTGNFNAWVEAGQTRDERKKRLSQVPEQWRKDVEIHVKTVFSLRRWQARQMKKAKNNGR
jgi:hypothetical protein